MEVVTLSVDVIVVTYNSAPEICACMTGVLSSADVERLIIVDNASSDDSVAKARAAGADLVIESDRNLGFARAVNLGLKQARADCVLLLNPDARLSGVALANMRTTLRQEAGAAIVAPLLRNADGATTSGAGRFATLTRRVGLCVPLVGRAPHFRPEYRLPAATLTESRALDVDYAFGAAMLLDRAFLTRTGGFDERFFLFAEDEDICRQARAAGRRVLLDTRAVARHVGGASCGDEVRTEAQRLYSTYLLFEKWRGSRAARIYHGGILQASRLRVAAARTERRPEAAAEVRTIARMFDEAIRCGVDPLLAGQADAASAPRPTRRGGRW